MEISPLQRVTWRHDTTIAESAARLLTEEGGRCPQRRTMRWRVVALRWGCQKHAGRLVVGGGISSLAGVPPQGGGRRVCHGAPATSAPVDHASRADLGRTVRKPRSGSRGRRCRVGRRRRHTSASPMKRSPVITASRRSRSRATAAAPARLVAGDPTTERRTASMVSWLRGRGAGSQRSTTWWWWATDGDGLGHDRGGRPGATDKSWPSQVPQAALGERAPVDHTPRVVPHRGAQSAWVGMRGRPVSLPPRRTVGPAQGAHLAPSQLRHEEGPGDSHRRGGHAQRRPDLTSTPWPRAGGEVTGPAGRPRSWSWTT